MLTRAEALVRRLSKRSQCALRGHRDLSYRGSRGMPKLNLREHFSDLI